MPEHNILGSSRVRASGIREVQHLECDICGKRKPDVKIRQTGIDRYVELVNICDFCETNYTELTA